MAKTRMFENPLDDLKTVVITSHAVRRYFYGIEDGAEPTLYHGLARRKPPRSQTCALLGG
jgi:hypothetical protein